MSLITKAQELINMKTNMMRINTGKLFNNQYIKSNIIMVTMWKHHKTCPRMDTRRTSMSLWKILFLTKQNLKIMQRIKIIAKQFKGYHYFYWRVSLIVILIVALLFGWHLSRLWVTNTVLEAPKFEIAYENYSSTQLHRKFFENLRWMIG